MARPRKHPEGTDRQALRRARVKAEGGKSVGMLLSAEGVENLEAIRADSGETTVAVIERLLREERARLGLGGLSFDS